MFNAGNAAQGFQRRGGRRWWAKSYSECDRGGKLCDRADQLSPGRLHQAAIALIYLTTTILRVGTNMWVLAASRPCPVLAENELMGSKKVPGRCLFPDAATVQTRSGPRSSACLRCTPVSTDKRNASIVPDEEGDHLDGYNLHLRNREFGIYWYYVPKTCSSAWILPPGVTSEMYDNGDLCPLLSIV